jgi:hypothetical protein
MREMLQRQSILDVRRYDTQFRRRIKTHYETFDEWSFDQDEWSSGLDPPVIDGFGWVSERGGHSSKLVRNRIARG